MEGSDVRKKSADELLDEARQAMRAAYMTHVDMHADDFVDRMKAGDFEDSEAFLEALHEDVDGDSWVIYTHKAQAVVMISDNAAAYVDDFGADGLVADGDVNWSAMACSALERDILDELERRGIDVNADDFGLESDEDEAE